MTRLPDFEALYRASPYPYLLMDTALVIIGANDAYLRLTGRTEVSIIGRHAFDAFPVNPDDPASTKFGEVRASLERTIATGQPDTMAFCATPFHARRLREPCSRSATGASCIRRSRMPMVW